MNEKEIRIESDSMGKVDVPASCLWGAQTQRAVLNGPGVQLPIPGPMLKALALVKLAAAETNGSLGVIGKDIAHAIVGAANEVLSGILDEQFPVGVFQTGSGTSWNMNVNEVISNRANQILGHPLGERFPVHPNDHVNKCQSSNDVIPAAMNIAARLEGACFLKALEDLGDALDEKARTFGGIPKLGRTHLQDAVPMSLGQEFSGYTAQVRGAARRIESSFHDLEALALGGTALGTGTGAAAGFASGAIKRIAGKTDVPFREAENKFEAIAARDCIVDFMGRINSAAAGLMKIANDLRLLSSGPRGGFGEILLPSLQPGSSIMPGKVNPIIPETVIQACAFTMGAYTAVMIGGQNGPLELNIMQPLIAYETITSLTLLSSAVRLLTDKCIHGIRADEEACRGAIENSLAMATPLAGIIGYDRAAAIAYKAYERGITVRRAALDEGIDPAAVEKALDIDTMIYGDEKPHG